MLIKDWYIDYANIIEDIALQYPSLKIDNIYKRQDDDAPTENGDKIVIQLFPIHPKSHRNLTRINKPYIEECHKMFNDIDKKFENQCQCDIDKRENWAYIYIIL